MLAKRPPWDVFNWVFVTLRQSWICILLNDMCKRYIISMNPVGFINCCQNCIVTKSSPLFNFNCSWIQWFFLFKINFWKYTSWILYDTSFVIGRCKFSCEDFRIAEKRSLWKLFRRSFSYTIDGNLLQLQWKKMTKKSTLLKPV